MSKPSNSLLFVAILMILAAAFSRLVLYPFNFSPIIGMAVFSGAVIKDKRLSFAIPLLAMFISDVLFQVFNIAPGFWGWGQLLHYGIYALVTCIGFGMKKISVLNVAGLTLAASLVFFLLSNSVFFLTENPVYHTYPQGLQGYWLCLAGGLPFLKNGIVTDLVYSGLLFGTYYFLQKKFFLGAVMPAGVEPVQAD
jgi:hypothetical protein